MAMHLSPAKTIRLLIALAVAAQCSIVEAKPADRRILPSIAKRPVSAGAQRGRDLVNGYQLANGLETTGIYGMPSTGLPGTNQHVVVSSPTSCMPGQPNCVMPNQIQANPNVTPNPSMLPILLSGLPALMKAFTGGNGSNQSRAAGRNGTSAGSPGPRPRTGSGDEIPQPAGHQSQDTPPGPRTADTPAGPPGRQQSVQIDGGQCQSGNRTNLQQILNGAVTDRAVSTTEKDANQKPMTTLKYTGSTGIALQSPSGGTVEIKATPGPTADQISCEKVLTINHAGCIGCKMTVRFIMAKNPTGDAAVNSCAASPGAQSMGVCASLVTLGAKSGVSEVHVGISDSSNHVYTDRFLQRQVATVAPRAPTADQVPCPPGMTRTASNRCIQSNGQQ